MKIRANHQQLPEIGMAPLIDCVLLLLIFFMVSTTFKHESELQIELPSAGQRVAPDPQRKAIELSIDQQGRFFVNQEALVNTQLGTLTRALQQAAAGRREVAVLILADARTPHQAVMTAMDAAGRAGLLRISFAAIPVVDQP